MEHLNIGRILSFEDLQPGIEEGFRITIIQEGVVNNQTSATLLNLFTFSGSSTYSFLLVPPAESIEVL